MGGNRRTWRHGTKFPGVENAGTSCAWVAKCNIINVRGHVIVNVTAVWGGPAYIHCRRQFKAATETYEIQLCRSQPWKLSLRITAATRRQLHAEIHPQARRVKYSWVGVKLNVAAPPTQWHTSYIRQSAIKTARGLWLRSRDFYFRFGISSNVRLS